jgi:hypothetical protein
MRIVLVNGVYNLSLEFQLLKRGQRFDIVCGLPARGW